MDPTRAYIEALIDGDAGDEDWPGAPRRHDMVGTWPSDRLGELIEARPDLLPELQRRRPRECEQA